MEEFDLTREEAIAFMRSKAFMAMLPSRPIFRQNKAQGGPIEQPTLVNEPGAAPPSERADDVPMNLDKGDFVLPAKTVELSGIQDINTKLEKATKSAVNNGEQLSQETIGKTGTIPVNVHNGEIIVPEQLVPHIGKESLEKMKNRGLEAQREEEQQEQQEQQQNPLGQQQNALGNPGAAGVAQMGQAIGLAEGGTTLERLYDKLFGSKKREPREGHHNPQSGIYDERTMVEDEDRNIKGRQLSKIGMKNYWLKQFAQETDERIKKAIEEEAPEKHILDLKRLYERIDKRIKYRQEAFEEFQKEPIQYREEGLNLQNGGYVENEAITSAGNTAPFSSQGDNYGSNRALGGRSNIPELKPGPPGFELSSDPFINKNQKENKTDSELGDRVVNAYLDAEGSGINLNDPGSSRFGVTGKTLAEHFGYRGMSDEQQRQLVSTVDREFALQFIKSEFFHNFGIDKLPDELVADVFDFAANAGPDRAGRALQNSINSLIHKDKRIIVDGVIGSKTLSALKGLNLDKVYKQFRENRREWIETNSSKDYKKGLLARMNAVTQERREGLYKRAVDKVRDGLSRGNN